MWTVLNSSKNRHKVWNLFMFRISEVHMYSRESAYHPCVQTNHSKGFSWAILVATVRITQKLSDLDQSWSWTPSSSKKWTIEMQVWPCSHELPRLLGIPLSHSNGLSSPSMNPMSSIEKSLGSTPEYRFLESASRRTIGQSHSSSVISKSPPPS